MYIVFINGHRHSAWTTHEEARQEEITLLDSGYDKVYQKFIAKYRGKFLDGHYFV